MEWWVLKDRVDFKLPCQAESGHLQKIHRLLSNPRLFFGTVLIGNNLSIIGFSAVGVRLYESMSANYGVQFLGGLLTLTLLLDVVIKEMGKEMDGGVSSSQGPPAANPRSSLGGF